MQRVEESIPELTRSKDVVDGVLAAATGLTGFVLIFLSLALSSLQRSHDDDSGGLVQTYRRAAGIAFVAFVVGVAVIGFSLLWLRGRSAIVYSLISWFFAAELLLVAIAAGMITWKTVRPSPRR
jgi:vacuolar-type H+-ATPase subunit I/STV1